jgi:hypothetical protein
MVMTAPDEKRDLYSPARKPPERPVLRECVPNLIFATASAASSRSPFGKFQNILHGRTRPSRATPQQPAFLDGRLKAGHGEETVQLVAI